MTFSRGAAAALLVWAYSGLALAADFSGPVVSVQDGDTFTVRTSDGKKHRIRVDGIDAPERTQPYSQISRNNLIALVGDSVVVSSNKFDRHGRPVGTVRNAAGQDVGLGQIKAGLAWHFKRYEHEQTPENRAAYAAAEAIAKAARSGLWRDAEPLAPWEFRANADRSSSPNPVGARHTERP